MNAKKARKIRKKCKEQTKQMPDVKYGTDPSGTVKHSLYSTAFLYKQMKKVWKGKEA